MRYRVYTNPSRHADPASRGAGGIGRFEFTFTPKHGSWLNLVEGFFSKLARSVLRHIRVASKLDRRMGRMELEEFDELAASGLSVPPATSSPIPRIRTCGM
jgi:hypothetical protein